MPNKAVQLALWRLPTNQLPVATRKGQVEAEYPSTAEVDLFPLLPTL
jgi:hypothetical protein